MTHILQMIFCFIATYFYTMTMNAPKNTLVYSSVIAAFGYLIYEYSTMLSQPMLGFLLGTSLVAALGEILARKLRVPATIFIFPGVIPIVPGFGLYETILAFVQDDIYLALEKGATTILSIACMAIAMALVSIMFLKFRIKKAN